VARQDIDLKNTNSNEQGTDLANASATTSLSTSSSKNQDPKSAEAVQKQEVESLRRHQAEYEQDLNKTKPAYVSNLLNVTDTQRAQSLQDEIGIEREVHLQEKRKREELEKQRVAEHQDLMSSPVLSRAFAEQELAEREFRKVEKIWALSLDQIEERIDKVETEYVTLYGQELYDNRLLAIDLYFARIDKIKKEGKELDKYDLDNTAQAVTDAVLAAEDHKLPLPIDGIKKFAEMGIAQGLDSDLKPEIRLRALEHSVGLFDDLLKAHKAELPFEQSREITLKNCELRVIVAEESASLVYEGRDESRIRGKAIAAANTLSEYLEKNPQDQDAKALYLRAILEARKIESISFKEYAWPEVKQIEAETGVSKANLTTLIPVAEERLIGKLAKELIELERIDVNGRDLSTKRALGFTALAELATLKGKTDEAKLLAQEAQKLERDGETSLRLIRVFSDLGELNEARKISLELGGNVSKSDVSKSHIADTADKLVTDATLSHDPTLRAYAERADGIRSVLSDVRNELFNRVTLQNRGINYSLNHDAENVAVLTEERSVIAVTAALFDIPRDNVTSLHLKLLAQSNPEIAEVLLKGEGFLPQGTEISLSLTPNGSKFERVKLEGQILALEMVLDPEVEKSLKSDTPMTIEGRAKAEEMLNAMRAQYVKLSENEEMLGILKSVNTFEKTSEQNLKAQNLEARNLIVATLDLNGLSDSEKRIADLLNSSDPRVRDMGAQLFVEVKLTEAKILANHAEYHLSQYKPEIFESSINQSIKVLKEALREQSLTGMQQLELMQKMTGLSLYKVRAIRNYAVHEELAYERSLPNGVRDPALVKKFEKEHERCLTEVKETLDGVKVQLQAVYESTGNVEDIAGTLRQIDVEKHSILGAIYSQSGRDDLAKVEYISEVAASLGVAGSSLTPTEKRNISPENREFNELVSFFRSDTQVLFLKESDLKRVLTQFETLNIEQQNQFINRSSKFADYAATHGDVNSLNAMRQVLESVSKRASEKLSEVKNQVELEVLLSQIVQSDIAKGNYLVAIGDYNSALVAMSSASDLAEELVTIPYGQSLYKEAVFSKAATLSAIAISGDYDLQLETALKIRSLRYAEEAKIARGRDMSLSQEEIGALAIIEANTLLRIKAPSLAKETFDQLESQREYYKGVDFIERALDSFKENKEGNLASALQVALSETNSESLGEAVGFGLGGAVGGAAAGAVIGVWFFGVGALPGAAVGGLVGVAAGTGYLKVRNVARGWDRIDDAYATGINDISAKQTLFDMIFLAADVVSIFAPLKGVGFTMKAGGRITTDALADLSKEDAKLIMRQQFAKDFVGNTTAFGGKAVTALTVAGITLPLADAAYSISQMDLSAEEKTKLFETLQREAGAAVAVAVVYAGANYTIGKLVDDPIKTLRDLRKNITASDPHETSIKFDLDEGKFAAPELRISQDGPSKSNEIDISWAEDAFKNSKEPTRTILKDGEGNGGKNSSGDSSGGRDSNGGGSYKDTKGDPSEYELSLELKEKEVGVAVLDKPEPITKPKVDLTSKEKPPSFDEGIEALQKNKLETEKKLAVEQKKLDQLQKKVSDLTYSDAAKEIIKEEIVKLEESKTKIEKDLARVNEDLSLFGVELSPKEKPAETKVDLKPELSTRPQPQVEPVTKAKLKLHPEPFLSPEPYPELYKVPESNPSKNKTGTEEQTKRRRRMGFGLNIDENPYKSSIRNPSGIKYEESEFSPSPISLPGKERRKRNVLQKEYVAVERVVKEKETTTSSSIYSLKKRPTDKIFYVDSGTEVEKNKDVVDYESRLTSVEKFVFVVDDDG